MQKRHYSDAPAYCHPFFDLVTERNLIEALENSRLMTTELIESIPQEKAAYQYQQGKWTVKQVLSHINDCERVYAYRAMRLSRKDNTALAGFDENLYALNAAADKRTLQQIANEFNTIRKASISLYEYLTDDMLDCKGIANNVIFTARSLGYMIAGHNIHHCNIIRQYYL